MSKHLKGFTVIEALIVLMIVVLLATFIIGAFSNGNKEDAKLALDTAGYVNITLLDTGRSWLSDEKYYYEFQATNSNDKVVTVKVTYKWGKGYTIRY